MTRSDKPPIFASASSVRPQTYPVLRGTMIFDSPYPPMPQRGDSGAQMPPPVHAGQQYSQSRTHDRRAMPRRATTGVVPPQPPSSRRNASGPFASGRYEWNRSLMFYGQPIDTAAAQASADAEFDDSSDDDPISATILDNASVPMFVPSRVSSRTHTASGSNQSLFEYPSISSYTPHPRHPSSPKYQVYGSSVPVPSSPRHLLAGPSSPRYQFTEPSSHEHPWPTLSSSPSPVELPSPQNSFVEQESPWNAPQKTSSPQDPLMRRSSHRHPSPEPSSPRHQYHKLTSPSASFARNSSPENSATTSSSSLQLRKGLQESPSRVPREFPQAATAFAAAIQEAEHRLHNSSLEESKENTDPDGVAHFKNLEGMFDEIKKLSICAEDTGKGTISRWTFNSKLARQRPSILKDLPSSVAPEKGKGKGKDTSPTLGTFARSRKVSMSAEKPKTRSRKGSVSAEQPKKRNVSGLWKRGSDSSTKPAFTKPAENRFSLDEEVNRPNMGDFAMVDFVWSLKSSCPVTKNITQYGEWERMVGEDGRSDEFSLLNPPQ
ncbi:uncharacterized protein LAJ45_04788 [Morchella importuna]|uniref:uncharacterized protein n=1 Tax=Morchella importuna TaxID=1174673 RepID=UPI001E8CB74D|nr:uncharacterized protein LAJ45_04788 [Morchella importuna]KAH8151086.1 hypothetical protein LAJ45_04788 [Morchella importuna]